MTEILVTYSEAKDTIKRMYSLIRRTLSGQRIKLTLETSIYQDLGVLGLDWDSFLEEFEKEFDSNLEGLQYNIYFDEEGIEWSDIFLFPFRVVFLPFRLLPEKWTKSIRNVLYRNKKRLTIGDLVLSAMAKKFTKREQTILKIK